MNNSEKPLSMHQKKDLKDLLEDLSSQIKSREEVNWVNTPVDEKLLKMSKKVDTLLTEKEAKEFLDDVKEELAVLREYQNFEELLWKLERKVDKLRETFTHKIKKEIANLQKEILDGNNLTPEQMLVKARLWRKTAANEIEKWIVAKLAQREDWIWRLAKKALW